MYTHVSLLMFYLLCLTLFQLKHLGNETLNLQFSYLKLASLRFLSTLLCSSTYTEILVAAKGSTGERDANNELRDVLKSIMKSMTHKAVLASPISMYLFLCVFLKSLWTFRKAGASIFPNV